MFKVMHASPKQNRTRTSRYIAAGYAPFFIFYHVKNFFLEISYIFLLRVGIIIIIIRCMGFPRKNCGLTCVIVL